MPRRSRKTSDLATWLGTSRTPLFVLDAERRIRVFNAGCQSLTGWTAADVVGEVCHYSSAGEVAGAAALAASLCPPPEAAQGTELAIPSQVPCPDGQIRPRLVYFFPLRDEQQQVTGYLGLIGDWQPDSAVASTNPAHRLHAELAAVRSALRNRFGWQTLVASSVAMKRVLVQAELALSNRVFVLLEGESGSGREHLARVIHFGGSGRQHWFVPLDCRRLAPAELERVLSRLLEIHRGPGSDQPAPQAGTLYLADVESLPRDLQVRLCEFFQSRGDSRESSLRLLASTSQSLETITAGGALRSDFAGLISPLVIRLPPLRDRVEDIPLLAQHFLEDLNRQHPRQMTGFSEEVIAMFQRHRWPRNLDELWETVRDAHAAAQGTLIEAADLPQRLRGALAAQQLPPAPIQAALPLDAILTQAETRLIRQALKRSGNNRSRAAEILGIHRTRLIRRIEQLGLGEPKASVSTGKDDPVETAEAGLELPEGDVPSTLAEEGPADE